MAVKYTRHLARRYSSLNCWQSYKWLWQKWNRSQQKASIWAFSKNGIYLANLGQKLLDLLSFLGCLTSLSLWCSILGSNILTINHISQHFYEVLATDTWVEFVQSLFGSPRKFSKILKADFSTSNKAIHGVWFCNTKINFYIC